MSENTSLDTAAIAAVYTASTGLFAVFTEHAIKVYFTRVRISRENANYYLFKFRLSGVKDKALIAAPAVTAAFEAAGMEIRSRELRSLRVDRVPSEDQVWNITARKR